MTRFVPVHLMKWKRQGGKIKVERIVAKRGDFIVWDARGTQGTVRLFFPDTSLFGIQVVDVPGREARCTRVLSKSKPQKGYRYSAYFDEIHDFAIGASSPIIIVKG